MGNDYFNKHEFVQAFALIYKNPFLARTKLQQYLEKYPRDYSAYPYYATTLIHIGLLDEAEEVLEKANELVNDDEKYADIDSNGKKKVSYFFTNYLYTKIRLLCYQGKFEEVYKLCQTYDNIDSMELEKVIFYCKRKLGLLGKIDDINSYSYILRQMINYSEDDFRIHIKKHLASCNEGFEDPNESVFSIDFPIDAVLNEIKKYIFSDKRLFHGFFDDLYIFKYNGCGKFKSKLTDYFYVICFHDTDNIITMYPIEKADGMPHIDLNYLMPVKDDGKVRKLSQIDKFNKKYKR